MILRRFMQHVKEQNWFAVGLDVIVVIVGIFLGLQVQAWYEARAERELEQFYLYQLHGEIEEAEPYATSSIEQINFVNETLAQILVIYRENSSFEPFTELQCNAMIRSHVIANFIAPLTTIDEIEETGRSLIIQNNSLRNLIANYKAAKYTTDRQLKQMGDHAIRLTSRYPKIIKHREEFSKRGGFDIKAVNGNTCDVSHVENYPSFVNDLVGNAERNIIFINAIRTLFDAHQKLHDAIDVELGIDHAEIGS